MTTILCIEDETLLREEIVGGMEDDGYDVLQAADGREGLAMILKHEPDLVICDVTMPHMNGHDLLKTLRGKHPRFADTPFIFLSALAGHGDILEGMNLGADDYLTKPIDFDLLLGKIEARLRQVARMQAKKEQQLTHMVHHDSLTNLPNRLFLIKRIEQALKLAKRGKGFAVFFLDLDGFKIINDTYGHAVGDELLIAVAGRLHGCVREIDTIARLGGDEFAIIQALSQQPQDAAILAQRISDALRVPIKLKDHQVVVDTSIGIAFALQDGTDPDQLLKSADLALYRAKDEGRGKFCFFEPEMAVRMKERLALDIDLRKALENSEFELYYQPVINLKENKVISFEALLRWNHPKRGIISPDVFINVAEETGLINPIGEWVLNQACAEAATWPDEIKVGVNLSPVQFNSGNLILRIINALADSGLPASRLELEITESVLLQNNENTLVILHQLFELGARIAMDDFGTGYSSLSYLQSFPFDKIKIDRSFISDLSEGTHKIAIVRAVADLAGALGMVITAEGVETEEQLEIIRAQGFTEAQGYLFSRPRPAEEIARLFLPQLETKSDNAA